MADQLRDLFLYVPDPILTGLARTHGIKTAGLRKLQLAQQLAKAINSTELEQLLDAYRYGGRGSVIWFRPTMNGEPITLSNAQVREKLRVYCSGDPFGEDLKPELERRPKVVNAKLLASDKVLVQMAYLEVRPRAVGFELKEEEETAFSRLVIRKGSLFFEVRAGRDKAVQMAGDIATAVGCEDKGQIVFNDSEMNNIIAGLGASVIAAKHKHPSGDFDTTEVVVSPELGDLQASSEYTLGLGILEGRRKRVQFTCTFGSDIISVRAELYPKTGNVVFRSYIDERVLDYVFERVKQVKGL
ncbi:hypothetical protein ACFLUR_00575 [Chloroflexota bacterium]